MGDRRSTTSTAAKAALAAAGFPEARVLPTITLTYNNDGGHEKIMQLVQSDLAGHRPQGQVRHRRLQRHLKKYDAGDVPDRSSRLESPTTRSWTTSCSRCSRPVAATTSPSYSNPAVDSGLDSARAIHRSLPARIAEYQAIDKTVGADLPVIPIMFYKHHHVASDRVHELHLQRHGPGRLHVGVARPTAAAASRRSVFGDRSHEGAVGSARHGEARRPRSRLGPSKMKATDAPVHRTSGCLQFIPVFFGVTLILFLMTTVLGDPDSPALR